MTASKIFIKVLSDYNNFSIGIALQSLVSLSSKRIQVVMSALQPRDLIE
jgi:hypothetical protein